MVVADEKRIEYLIAFFERLPVIMRTGDAEEQIDAEHEVVPALATFRNIDKAALSARARERYEYLKTLAATVDEILES